MVHGWDETWCKNLDYIRTTDSSHNASRAQRERYANMGRFKCSPTTYQLGPLRIRNDYKEATEAIMSSAIIEGQKVEKFQKEERHRSDALDPNLKKWLIWLSEIWHTYFTNDGSSSSSSSSTSWNYSWWSGNSKWYWKDDDWKEHKW